MAGRIKLSPAAKNDLADIWDFGADQWGPDRADSYIDDLRDRMIWLTANSSAGKRRDDIAPGLLSTPQGSYMIFFRATAGSIEIARILHQRMDVTRHL
jgi:toxin ParE1/3/4